MSDAIQITPKVFISYSWTSDQYAARVLDIATRLMNDGVEVVIDQWDLKGGHELNAFMEKCVNDHSVSHVLILSDLRYVERADGRKGGVSTETQIISPTVYSNIEQTRVLCVVLESNEDGSACVPTYLSGRLFFDFRSIQAEEQQYENLLRHLFNRPLNTRPALGKIPSYLSEDADSGSKTRHKLARAISMISSKPEAAKGAVLDYLDGLFDAISALVPTVSNDVPLDEALLEKVNESLVYRHEFVELATSMCRHRDLDQSLWIDSSFFGRLLKASLEQSRSNVSEGVQFITMELFLLFLCILQAHQRGPEIRALLDNVYASFDGMQALDFTTFAFRFAELERNRRQRLRTNRSSFIADLLKDRCASCKHVKFDVLQQMEFLLFLRGSFRGEYWPPRTLVYLDSGRHRGLPIFVAAASGVPRV